MVEHKYVRAHGVAAQSDSVRLKHGDTTIFPLQYTHCFPFTRNEESCSDVDIDPLAVGLQLTNSNCFLEADPHTNSYPICYRRTVSFVHTVGDRFFAGNSNTYCHRNAICSCNTLRNGDSVLCCNTVDIDD
eukprot:PhM_4_TR18491/c1_g7_i2/m.11594